MWSTYNSSNHQQKWINILLSLQRQGNWSRQEETHWAAAGTGERYGSTPHKGDSKCSSVTLAQWVRKTGISKPDCPTDSGSGGHGLDCTSHTKPITQVDSKTLITYKASWHSPAGSLAAQPCLKEIALSSYLPFHNIVYSAWAFQNRPKNEFWPHHQMARCFSI